MDNPFTRQPQVQNRGIRWLVIGLAVAVALAVGIGIGITAGSSGDSDTADSPVGGNRETPVTVLNNSTEAGLSKSVADLIRDSGWQNVGHGNLLGRIAGISERSRVYYPEDDARTRAVAEKVAEELGLAAAAGNSDYYDRFSEASLREGGAADAVVVVLTGPLEQ